MNSGQQVYANSKFDEEFFNLNNILYYDATETCVEGSSGPLIGSDNVEKVWNFFKSKGLPDIGVAALLGGKWGETGGSINPKAIESGQPYDEAKAMSTIDGYAFGIAQWDGDRRPRLLNYAKEKGQSWDTLELQLDFMWHELNTGYKDVLDTLMTGTLEEGVRMWVGDYGWGYERPAAEYVASRNAEGVAVGKQLLAKFGGKSSSQTTTSSYTFIGDSITVGVKSQLESTFSGSNVKAEIGQGVAWAISQVASDIKDNIVINIGTNDKFTNGKDLLEKLKDKKVYLVNVYGAGGNADFETTNKNISNAMSGYSNVKLLDWKSYVDQNGGRDKFYAQEAGGANYHLNNEGNNLYIKFLQENLGSSQNSNSNICGGSDGKFYTSSEATRQTPDGFSIFSQCDSRWANDAGFGGRNICDTACGPFSLIMAITALTGKADISSIINKSKPFSISGGGTSWDVASVVHDYGLKTHRVSNNEAEINKILNSGGMVMIAGQGPRPFISSGGHFVLVRKKTASGKWLIANPGGTDQTYTDDDMKEWDPSFILQYTNIGDAVAITK
jgi:hypothetical protein